MDDRELEMRLRALDVPPPQPENVEKAFDLACQAFNTTQKPTQTNRGRRPIAAASGILGIAATIALVVLLSQDAPKVGVSPVKEPQAGFFSERDWRRIIAETQNLFPGRLQAVVATADDFDIQLHDEKQRTSDQPILVTLQGKDGTAVELVSFSGEVVETEIGTSRVRLDLFLSASGDVLLTGDHFFWTRRDAQGLDTLAIRAWSLENGA